MKEKVKSSVLFILFIMALVLTYLNTLQPFFVLSQSESKDDLRSTIASVVKPRAVFYSNGQNFYTRVYDKSLFDMIWGQVMPSLTEIFDGTEVLKEIRKTEYVKAFENQSLLLVLTGVDRSLITNSGILGSFYCYEEILICEECLNVKLNGKYYSVTGKGRQNIKSIGEKIKLINGDKYRRVVDRFSLRDTLGTDEEYLNYYPFPYDYPTRIVKTSAKNEFGIKDRSYINDIAKVVIGDRLDFTQIFEDSAKSLVFVYNKGEKSLTFTVDGQLLYKARVTDSTRLHRDDFESSLTAAVEMIAKSGGIPEGLYLRNCTRSEDGKFIFVFNYKLAGQYAVLGHAAGVEVVVDGDMVVEMSRKIVLPELLVSAGTSNYIPVDQCIYKSLNIFTDFEDNEKLYSVCAKIEEVNMTFYYTGTELIPTWEVVINGKTYLFDANYGEYIPEEQ